MRIRVAFSLECNIEGDTVPRSVVIDAINDWLDSMGDEFGDAIVEYISEEYDIDHFETELAAITVGGERG